WGGRGYYDLRPHDRDRSLDVPRAVALAGRHSARDRERRVGCDERPGGRRRYARTASACTNQASLIAAVRQVKKIPLVPSPRRPNSKLNDAPRSRMIVNDVSSRRVRKSRRYELSIERVDQI